MADSNIEWTNKTWNPTTGCDKVSPGCAHCYAEGVAERFWATQYPAVPIPLMEIKGDPDNECPVGDPDCQSNDDECHDACEQPTRARIFTDVQTHADRLDQPLRWRKPQRIFVNSMSDLFHEDVPIAFIDQVFAVMALAPQHTFQILTKRPKRMRAYISSHNGWGCGMWFAAEKLKPSPPPRHWYHAARTFAWPLPNVWLGVSVENQHFADERIPLLLQTPAAVRFISAEPLLGPIALTRESAVGVGQLSYFRVRPQPHKILWPGLDWVIVGGESGPSARPFDVQWAYSIIEQCKTAGVPVFVKQLGGNPQQRVVYGPSTFEPDQPVHLEPLHLHSHKGGDMAEWPNDLRVREFPR